MLKITTLTTEEGMAIKLEGKLAGALVSELERTWREVSTGVSRNSVLVDLCGVTFIDVGGKKLLRLMFGEGAEFSFCGPDITATVEAVKREALSELSNRTRHS